MENYKDKIRKAIELLEMGTPKRKASFLTGIDVKTIGLYWTRFKDRGEKAFERQRYSLELKKKIILKHLEDKCRITSLSISYGIPTITIRRWVDQYKSKGLDGLVDKRKQSRDKGKTGQEPSKDTRYMDLANYALKSTIDAFHVLGTKQTKRIPELLKEKDALLNPAFYDFLFLICLIISRHHPEPSVVYNLARIELMMIPHDVTTRREAETILNMPETTIFISEYIDTVNTILWLPDYNDINSSISAPVDGEGWIHPAETESEECGGPDCHKAESPSEAR